MSPPASAAGDALRPFPVGGADPRLPLLNLSTVRSRMDSVQRFLSDSINNNTLIGKDQMDMVSTEIASAIHLIIVNGTALISCSQPPNLSIVSELPQSAHPIASVSSILNIENNVSDSDMKFKSCDSDNLSEFDLKSNSCEGDIKISNDKGGANLKVEAVEEEMNDNWEIIELDAVELLAEHIHFCDICGKGFKRDANLRMHMRAHGNQFKTPEALAKPEKGVESRRRTRFSCPFVGCNRNKLHKKFRPLKSVICVKNHFKRSHCPKMYSCNRCNKKSFSVVADLKSHLKHCGETKWKCSCGTSFSRKDKLFGHMALFEGHMPTVVEEEEKAKGVAVMMEEDEDEDMVVKEMELGMNCSDNGFFDGLLDGFDSIDNYCFQDVLGSSPKSGLCNGMDWDL